MSSSDSEDDSFLNIAQKLAAIINGPRNKIINESNESPSPDKNKKKSKSPTKRQRTDSGSSDSIDIEEFRNAFPPLNETKARRGRGRSKKTNTTRKRKNEQSSPNLADSQLCLPTRRKRRNAGGTANDSVVDLAAGSSTSVIETPPAITRNRGRGKGKGRGRTRNSTRSNSSGNVPTILDVLQSILPTYSVGNTDEYPDQCGSQQLFGSTQEASDVVQLDDMNDSADDEEISVKVEWQSSDLFKFNLRPDQPLLEIFDYFSKKENVAHDKLLFTYNDKIIKPTDSTKSIEYNIGKFIEGGVMKQSVAPLTDGDEVKDGIRLKFQCQNKKKPFETYIKPEDKMSVAMVRCAGHMGERLDKLKFVFDGETISGKSTPKDLDLEGDECIDVKILS